MTHAELLRAVDDLHQEVRAMLATKAHDYAGGENRFGNFIRRGVLQGIYAEQVVINDLTKHVDALCNFYRNDKEIEPTQTARERALDLVVYAILLHTLIRSRSVL